MILLLFFYLTIFPRVRVRYEMVEGQRGAWRQVGYSHLISNKCEGNNCLTLFVKTTDFQLVFNFEQMCTVSIFGEHGIMVHIP